MSSPTYFPSPIPEPPAATGVGLGYGIAIAVGILVLISTIMLASYVCVRVNGGPPRTADHPQPSFAPTVSGPPPTVVAVGLDEPTIESYPKFVYGRGWLPASKTPVKGPCPICLSEYRRDDVLRSMPECEHSFHASCVDEWLRLSATCPLCRSSPVPSAAATPVATPLSEQIPLAMHAR